MDCFHETDADYAILTETWLNEGAVKELAEELSLGSGIGMLTKNRQRCENGVTYGGVAVLWKESLGSFKEIEVKNPGRFEVLAAAGSVKGHRRKFVVIGCYLPPGYTKQRGKEALGYIEDLVIYLKRRFEDPYLVVAGDFNQWKIDACLADFVDVKEVDVGPTRGSRSIDRIFTNMSRSVEESGSLEPLETEEIEGIVRKSDHRVAYVKISLERRQTFKWETYQYRHYNDKSVDRFKGWVVMHGWEEVLSAVGSEEKAVAYQNSVVKAVERFFPLRKVRRKNTDPPWLDKKTKDMIEDRKKFFISEGGRTVAWKEEKKRTEEVVRKRKRGFLDIQKDRLLSTDACQNFYRNVRSFGTAERPKLFNVKDLLEDRTDEEAAKILAGYFNRISDKFDPLRPGEIPCTRDKDLPVLHEYEVAARIRRFKKPRSMVPGDIFPKLVTQFADFLAIPLTDIYNCITESKKWPRCWKVEFVTIIPKKTNPESLSDLRNISCTLLASKMYESYVLDWLKLEVALRSNQYGGVKGLGMDHLLVGLWQQVLENAEDYRAGTIITSIDYSKAFNRMGYQECLTALARNGASTPLLELVGTFLTDRLMTVKVGQAYSKHRKVNGGCPQGSILGFFCSTPRSMT